MTEQGTGVGGKVVVEGIGGSGTGKLPPSTTAALTGTASVASVMSKPVPMKLFSTWEVEKSTPSCVPRQCSLTLSRLVIMKALEHELHSVTIAMKMQSSKLVLRSNEIVLPPTGVLDVELELSFALLYPHFLKRDGNLLQVTLQRRKKYKNRTMLGYKTLASGHVNMSQVLQHPTDLEVPLYMGTKEHGKAVAFVMMMSLCSQPVDHDNPSHMMSTDADRSPGEVSEEEDARDDQDDSSNDDLSDVENLACDEEHRAHMRKSSHPLSSALASRQRNLKQKFVSLLRRFKVNDEALESAVDDLNGHDANPSFVEELFDEVENLSDSDLDIDTISVQSTPKPRLKPFFTPQSSSYSNLKPEKSPSHDVDRVSEENNSRTSDSDSSQLRHGVHTLPAYNCQLGQNVGQPAGAAAAVEPIPSDSKEAVHLESRAVNIEQRRSKASPKQVHKLSARKRSSSIGEGKLQKSVQSLQMGRRCSASVAGNEPRRALLDQLVAILSSENVLPDCVVLINNQDCQGPFQILAQAIQSPKYHTICTFTTVDVRAVLSATVNRIQKYCCKKSTTVLTKIAIIGSDGYISAVLKSYVELMSSKSPEWLTYLRFLFVPFGNSLISKALAALDVKYGLLFNDSFWKDNISEKSDVTSHSSQPTADISETVSRINRYLSGANHLVHLPLAEAILANKDKGSDDTSQLIVPFIGEVRLGPTDVSSSSLLGTLIDNDETSGSTSVGLSSSPPHSNPLPSEKPKDMSATPTSVSQHTTAPPSSHAGPTPSAEPQQPSASEAVDLQIDYWLMPSKVETSEKDKGERLVKKELKYSLKMMFRSMQVFRPLQQPGQQQLPQQQQSTQPHSTDGLSMIVVTREKKQKMMRIGKKSKELDSSKSQQIDGISRLICTSKSQNHPLSVTIDGVDWTGVKFFQVSAQWQTHIKNFPVLLFSSSSDLTSSF